MNILKFSVEDVSVKWFPERCCVLGLADVVFALLFQLSPRKRSLGTEWFLGTVLFASLCTRLCLSDVIVVRLKETALEVRKVQGHILQS